jgi:hypothetical protein
MDAWGFMLVGLLFGWWAYFYFCEILHGDRCMVSVDLPPLFDIRILSIRGYFVVLGY